MSKLKLYGISGSRAQRSLWAIEEVGVEYEHVAVGFGEDSKAPEFLAVNPNGRIPALVDGELLLFESIAINLYLAKQYGGDLYPSAAQSEALAWQWSVWAIAEIEPLQVASLVQKLFVPAEKRNERLIASSEKQLARPLAVLDAALAERKWLVGDAFGIADLNVAAVMLLLGLINFDYSAYTHVSDWAQRCYARPALTRARALP